MELEGTFFSSLFLMMAGLLSLSGLLLAVRLAQWRRLLDKEQLHVFLGACVALMVMWTLRTSVYAGLEFHLLFITTLTLMFGWSLAVIGGTLVLLGITLTGLADWDGFVLNMQSVVLLPATITQAALIMIRYWLPRHFFVYIYLNAFLSG